MGIGRVGWWDYTKHLKIFPILNAIKSILIIGSSASVFVIFRIRVDIWPLILTFSFATIAWLWWRITDFLRGTIVQPIFCFCSYLHIIIYYTVLECINLKIFFLSLLVDPVPSITVNLGLLMIVTRNDRLII